MRGGGESISVSLPGTPGGGADDPFKGKTFIDDYDKVVFASDGTLTVYDDDDEPELKIKYSFFEGKMYWAYAAIYNGVDFVSVSDYYDLYCDNFEVLMARAEKELKNLDTEEYAELAFMVGLPPDSSAEAIMKKEREMNQARTKLFCSQIHIYLYERSGNGYDLTEQIMGKNGLEMGICEADFKKGNDSVDIESADVTDCLRFSAELSGTRYKGYLNTSTITFYKKVYDRGDYKYKYEEVDSVPYTVSSDGTGCLKAMAFSLNGTDYELPYKPDVSHFVEQ